MTIMIQTDPPDLPREMLATMYDLPSEEIAESDMPDEFHFLQALLLKKTFKPPTGTYAAAHRTHG